MSILVKIAATLDQMSPGDRQIGQFIVKSPEQVLRLSSASLATETGTSQSSIVKFSQKLGFTGYSDLKLAVSEAKAQRQEIPDELIHGTIQAGDTYSIVAKKLIGSKLLSIQQTLHVNKEKDIRKALDLLNKAQRVHLVGVGASSLVARDFSYKLLKLGRNVQYDSDSHIQMANASTLGSKDVLFALSHSGASIETVRIAEVAKRCEAKVIGMTRVAKNPLQQLADVRLFTVADEEKVRSSAITARDAQLTLTDLLFILLVQTQTDAHEHIMNSEAAMAVLNA
jgi:DNA-binding MurR/RpiR family transcriptional regulator